MPSWTCGYPGCGWDQRHPVKYPVLDHIREKHLDALKAAVDRRAEVEEEYQKPDEDSLIRASLERSEKDPDRDLEGEPLEPVEA